MPLHFARFAGEPRKKFLFVELFEGVSPVRTPNFLSERLNNPISHEAKNVYGETSIDHFNVAAWLLFGPGQTIRRRRIGDALLLFGKAFDNFLEKGFTIKRRNLIEDQMAFHSIRIFAKNPCDSNAPVVNRRIDVYKKQLVPGSSAEEYLAGQNRLKAMNFFWSEKMPIRICHPVSAANADCGCKAKTATTRIPAIPLCCSGRSYRSPAKVVYAEDLLRFESHEYLVSFLEPTT